MQSPPALFSKLSERLWMGSAPAVGCGVQRHFDVLVMCAAEYQLPTAFPGTEVILAPMRDDGTPMVSLEGTTAVRAAGMVARHVASGRRVLVTCMQGRNRSGLVCAIAMCRADGLTPDEAVERIRAARGPSAMRNEWFNDFLARFCVRDAAAGSGTAGPSR